MAQLKAGIIGCGGIAKGKHLPSLKSITEVEIVAFCDINTEIALAAKEKFGGKDAAIYTEYQEVITRSDIDVVYVLTSNRLHSEITVAALRAGKHVMCEKPMAMTSAEAEAMVNAANETGKLLTIGYQNRFRSDVQAAKKLCAEGTLGDIYFAKAHALRRRAVPTWGKFLDKEEQGGGPLIDIGTHALDMTLWLMDNYEPASVTGSVYHKLNNQTNTGNSWGDWDPEKFTVEDSAFAFIKMKNGATIQLESSWALNTLDVKEAKCTLCGTRAGLDMEDGLRINHIMHGNQTVTRPDFSQKGVAFFDGAFLSEHELEQRVFVDAILKGTPLTVKPEQALMVTKLLEAIYESSRTDKTIYF